MCVFFVFKPVSVFAFQITGTDKDSINSVDEEIRVDLDISQLPDTNSYFRVGFVSTESSTSYFGKLKNEQDNWIEIGSLSDCSNYYFYDGDKDIISIKTKIGEEKEAGTYYIKAHRITSTCGSSKSTDNNYEISLILPSPSPEPSPTEVDSAEPSAEPEQALVKIEEVKDEDKEEINSVKIYLDDKYLKHYAPEEIEFCDDCEDNQVKCNFGKHVFKLEKSGYHTWEQEKNIEKGKEYIISVVLDKIEPKVQPLPSPSELTVSPAPSPVPTPSPDKKKVDIEIASISGMVLGATESGLETEKSPFPSASNNGGGENTKANLFPFLFIGTGSVIISTVFFLLWQQKMLKNLW